MKKLIGALVGLGLASFAFAADFTAGVNTPNNQLYNASIRDIKDGTNAPTMDVVTGNSLAQTTGLQTVIKASGGYLESITLNGLCANGTTTYIIADAAAAAGSYATVISTIPANATAPITLPIRGRFSNGLTLNVTSSTCSVTVSYR